MSLRIFSIVVLFALLTLAMSGCARPPADPLAYQREAAGLLLTGTLGEQNFSARLDLVPPADDEAGIFTLDARDFTLSYTAPAELAGLTLMRQNGRISLCSGSVTIEDPDTRFISMLAPAMLFCIDCEMGDAVVIEQNGTTLNRIEAVDDEGRYLLWLDADGWPRRIEAVMDGRTILVDVLRMPAGEGTA